jgi:hypothetical protein
VIRQAGGETPFCRQRFLLIAKQSGRLEGCCRQVIALASPTEWSMEKITWGSLMNEVIKWPSD